MKQAVPSFPDGYSAGTSGLTLAAATSDGKVWIASEPAGELYDPVTKTFSLVGSMVAVDQGGHWGKPNELMSAIHDLMPVILGRADEDAWLDPEFQAPEAVKKLLKPCPSKWMQLSGMAFSAVCAVRKKAATIERKRLLTLTLVLTAWVAELADAPDLKSGGPQGS